MLNVIKGNIIMDKIKQKCGILSNILCDRYEDNTIFFDTNVPKEMEISTIDVYSYDFRPDTFYKFRVHRCFQCDDMEHYHLMQDWVTQSSYIFKDYFVAYIPNRKRYIHVYFTSGVSSRNDGDQTRTDGYYDSYMYDSDACDVKKITEIDGSEYISQLSLSLEEIAILMGWNPETEYI